MSSKAKAKKSPKEEHQSGDESLNEIWFREDERWELTWPIWHMLPKAERKALAQKHGFQHISDFEEWMSLQQTMKNSTNQQPEPYDNSLIYPAEAKPTPVLETKKEKDDEDDDDNASVSENLEEALDAEQEAAADRLPTDALVGVGGQILILPDEMLHRVFDWLPVDTYATLALTSPHWKSFTRTEAVYKRLCERLYLNQSKRRALHVSRFGNSYRTMLEKRPRVRAGGGVYVMKYARVKPIQRDMWTEIPVGAILETVYYRYLYFQEDGRVLYALTTAPPHDMFRRFLKMCLTREPDEAAVWGTYQVAGNKVTVTARQPWQHVQLEMMIQPNNLHGRNGLLSFDRHMTSSSGSFDEWCPDRIVYEVPGEPFRFIKDKRL